MYIVVFCSTVSTQLHCATLQSGYTTICHHAVKGANKLAWDIANTAKFRLANFDMCLILLRYFCNN